MGISMFWKLVDVALNVLEQSRPGHGQ